MPDTILLIISFALFIAGIIGCFVPVMPGTPLTFAGLVLLSFTSYDTMSGGAILIYGLMVVLVTVLDYVIPAYSAKRSGGSRQGISGAMAGALAGAIFPPVGIMFGAFLGAIAGEMMAGKPFKEAYRAGVSAFLGFVMSILLKVVLCVVMIVHALLVMLV